MPSSGKRLPQAATPDSVVLTTEAATHTESSDVGDSRMPKSSMQDKPAPDVGVCKGATVAKGEQRGRKRCWDAEAGESGVLIRTQSKASTCRSDSMLCAACATMLHGSSFTEEDIRRHLGGAKQIVCLDCRDKLVRLQALMDTSHRAACTCKRPPAHTTECPMRVRFAGDLPYPGCDVMCRADSDWLVEQRRKHKERASSISTFPISCCLRKHEKGFYILSGICFLCSKTFRGVGACKSNGVVNRWATHSTVQKRMMDHARTHGVVGYTPRRNLDTMRLDWTLSRDETSAVIPRSGKRTPHAGIPDSRVRPAEAVKDAVFLVEDNPRQTTGQKGAQLTGSIQNKHKKRHCRKCHCSKCGVYQVPSAFRRTAQRRVDICRTCELIPCAECAAVLPRHSFTKNDIYGHFGSAKQVTCLVCKENEYARLQRLRQLMNTSHRAACTCKHPLSHTKKCPMHVRFAGDVPYPGCDVMSRAESDWFVETLKKKKHLRAMR